MVLFQRGLSDHHSSRETCQLCGECQQPEREEKRRGREGEEGRQGDKELLTLTPQEYLGDGENTYLHTGVHEICRRTNVYKLMFLLLQDEIKGHTNYLNNKKQLWYTVSLHYLPLTWICPQKPKIPPSSGAALSRDVM